MSKPSNEELYANFLEVNKSLMETEVPERNRVMYYKVYNWWRHPIKRYKQKRDIKKLLVTTDV